MPFKSKKRLYRCVALLSLLIHPLLLANNSKDSPINSQVLLSQLTVKPAKCVALNQGRTCYAQVDFTWQSQHKDQLCLYQKQPRKKIACWQPPRKTPIKFEFKSNETKHYQLINQQQNVLAETMVEVNWVYDSGPRKRNWRVF